MGSNFYGRLGLGSRVQHLDKPTKVSSINGTIKEIYTDDSSIFVLTTDGSLYTWGDNRYGQLCLGNTQQINTPAKVNGINGTINKIYTCISVYVTNDNSLYSFGYNNFVSVLKSLQFSLQLTPSVHPQLFTNNYFFAGDKYFYSLQSSIYSIIYIVTSLI